MNNPSAELCALHHVPHPQVGCRGPGPAQLPLIPLAVVSPVQGPFRTECNQIPTDAGSAGSVWRDILRTKVFSPQQQGVDWVVSRVETLHRGNIKLPRYTRA
jgi:hypothetical protein